MLDEKGTEKDKEAHRGRPMELHPKGASGIERG
jgi:hypothetical protein